MAITDWSGTASANATVLGVNIGEGCAPGNVNNAIRQVCADVANGINFSVLAAFLSSSSLSNARSALGVPSTSASMTAFGTLANSANKLPYMTGSDAWSLADLTSFARSILAAGDAAAVNALLSGGTALGVTALSIANPGYVKLAIGSDSFTIQWGSQSVSASGGTITYPVAFSSFSVAVCNSGNSDPQNNGAAVSSASTTGFTYTTGTTASGTISWHAFGK